MKREFEEQQRMWALARQRREEEERNRELDNTKFEGFLQGATIVGLGGILIATVISSVLMPEYKLAKSSYLQSYSLMQSNRFDEARNVASNYFSRVRENQGDPK